MDVRAIWRALDGRMHKVGAATVFLRKVATD